MLPLLSGSVLDHLPKAQLGKPPEAGVGVGGPAEHRACSLAVYSEPLAPSL